MPAYKSSASGQKFIARNRAPRVQIEYDVELYGAERKVELPFVMGVLSDLAGARAGALPDLSERNFVDIDIDHFDERMKSMGPTLSMEIDNTLTGEGKLHVDMALRSLDDFSPAAIARNVEPLARLLQARTQLSNLLSYIDGKRGAEMLVAHALADPKLLSELSSSPVADAADRADGADHDGLDENVQGNDHA